MDMEFTMTEKELNEFLNQYYSNYDGIKSFVTIQTKLGEDRGTEFSYTEYKVIRSMNVLGKERYVEIEIREQDIKEAIKEALEEIGFTLEKVTFNNYLKKEYETYGIFPQAVAKPMFDGITVKYKEFEKKK